MLLCQFSSLLMSSNNKTKQWRINNSVFKDKDFVSVVKEKTQEYIDTNLNSVQSVQTVWEAYKATCRGWIISYSTAKKKEKMAMKQRLTTELKDLEAKHMLDSDNLQLKNLMLITKTELQTFLHEENAFALF